MKKIAPGSRAVVDTTAINRKKSFKLETVANNAPLLIGQAARVAANIAKSDVRHERKIDANRNCGCRRQPGRRRVDEVRRRAFRKLPRLPMNSK